jgi:aryl-alcohol dehydrogenase-like predicted oxidoreductase
MRTRSFDASTSVSEIGLGCWQFGGDWRSSAASNARDTLHAALDAGVNFLDTADVYGQGRSESLIGEELAERAGGDRVFVATKLGRLEGYPDGYSRDLFRRCTENSLKRLRRDSLDLTQLHCVPAEALRRGDVFDWLDDLKGEGLIRRWGASVESVDEGMLCLDREGCSSLQVIFNLFRQKPAAELLPRAREQGVAIIVRLPLASGLLSGKYRRETSFEASDHRSYNRNGAAFNVGETFAGIPFEQGVELADALKPHHEFWAKGAAAGATMPQWAMRWILDHPAVTTVIPGASGPDQARQNAAVSDLPPLSEEEHESLRAFHDSEVLPHIRGPY